MVRTEILRAADSQFVDLDADWANVAFELRRTNLATLAHRRQVQQRAYDDLFGRCNEQGAG